ncbi:MAG: U32 family peptidase [Candidatus Delongbacteria bacterium]|nr:U32 family peptidase [Candidatus Delongbacteria bacterium]
MDQISQIKLELLSPAKNLRSGKLAILSGADAVYIGGPELSARSAAGNSWEDIEELIKFAHQYYSKVYVALNTIFYNEETEIIKGSIEKAYSIGADALIIQDTGILEMHLPPIPVHASTQCNNSDPEHIRFLRDTGFSRVILARELEIDQIEKISKKVPGIEMEAFVHGALCVSFSGRCYFSQYLSGRSANRGKCMQVCRLPFDLEDSSGKVLAKSKYLLSLKDMNLSGNLDQMINAGVTSFKIEGRLKDEAYVGNVTAAYSNEIDRIIENSNGKYTRASSGKVQLKYEPDLNKTFNRGFTKYFFNGRKEEVISPDYQKSLGEFIGKIKNISYDYFTLDRVHDLKNGEGICWFNKNNKLTGVNINKVEVERIYPNKTIPDSEGIEIYRNENPSFEKAVINGTERRIGLSFKVQEKNGVFKITATDEDNNQAEIEFNHVKIIANKPEGLFENWKKQFSKLGDSIFYFDKIELDPENKYFIPLSVLNEKRREIISAVLKVRIGSFPVSIAGQKISGIKYPEKILDSSFNISNEYAERFYKKHGAEINEFAAEISDNHSIKRVMTTKHCMKHWLGNCPVDTKKINSFSEPLYLVLKEKKFRLEFNCKDCIMEIYSE